MEEEVGHLCRIVLGCNGMVVLGFRAFVAELLEDLFDVAGHGDINGFVHVVPL